MGEIKKQAKSGGFGAKSHNSPGAVNSERLKYDYSKNPRFVIERKIIASSVGENRYNQVKFLEPSDFKNENFRKVFKVLQEVDGDFLSLVKGGIDTNYFASICDTLFVQHLGFLLLEMKIKDDFKDMIYQLSLKTNSIAESHFLLTLIDEIDKEDALDLLDGLPMYIEPYASSYALRVVSRYSESFKKRINRIKEVVRDVEPRISKHALQLIDDLKKKELKILDQ